MACGKPVLATNAGGIPELVREGVTGFTVPVSDDEQMALKVLEMVQNPDRLRLMGLNAAEIAKNEYGLDRMVQNYLDLYHELTDERNEQNAA
jgi:glycosyltransferase involved in cell wall biosynthesis